MNYPNCLGVLMKGEVMVVVIYAICVMIIVATEMILSYRDVKHDK